MLIDTSYFFADIQIGQLSEQSVQDVLELFISQYEPKILGELLGYETYKNLKEEDEIGSGSGGDPIYSNLLNGTEYTGKDGTLYRWNGLVDDTTKVSLIAYFVYGKYMTNQMTVTGGAGEGKIQMQNAIAVSSQRKIITVWNLMVKENFKLYHFLQSKREDYPEWSAWVTSSQFPYHLFTEANEFGI